MDIDEQNNPVSLKWAAFLPACTQGVAFPAIIISQSR